MHSQEKKDEIFLTGPLNSSPDPDAQSRKEDETLLSKVPLLRPMISQPTLNELSAGQRVLPKPHPSFFFTTCSPAIIFINFFPPRGAPLLLQSSPLLLLSYGHMDL